MDKSAAVNRVYNFSAGPAVLPLPVLEQAQREMLALPGLRQPPSWRSVTAASRSRPSWRMPSPVDATCCRFPTTIASCSCKVVPVCSSP